MVLYQLLTDRLPFEQIDPEALFKAIQTEYPELPSAIEQDIPIPLQNICLRALEKDPKKRYTDAPAFLNDIQRFLRGEKVLSRPSFVMDKLQDYIKYAPIDTPTPRSSPTVKVITNPVEDAKSILGGYSERALSRLGEKVLAALMADDLSKESLGFDIKELKEGMTYIRAVELLTMPQELGGIVEGGGLFMLPEEYADLNPGCARNLRGKRQIISSYGCPNRCNFCSLGMGHTTVVSTPYPILIQVYLRGWFPDKQYTQTIFMVFFYAAAIKMKEDSIFYLDDVCGAYLTDLITFAQTYGCSMGNFVMTAGCSPFDPTVQYAREAAKGFLDIVLPENTLLSVTFNLYRPELISAIADLDREGLETAVNAYVDMYEEFLMYFSRNNAVYLIDKRLFSPVEGAEDPRRVYEGYAMTSNIINKLQRAALERVKRSKHIDHNKIIYDTIRIKWYKYDYSRQMAESLRATEKDDKNLREFLSKLNYDIDYGLWPAV